jgi:hypothetical protein
VREWDRHFQTFFEFLDIQKIRTPKGLDWLKAQYPALSQNELMLEMQGIRMLHCTIWVGGVREIVSAEDSDIKFITSDHPVTIYNHAVPPTDQACAYPLDPGISLRGSQTIYPMDRDHCLILTNLEYAKDPTIGPLEILAVAGVAHAETHERVVPNGAERRHVCKLHPVDQPQREASDMACGHLRQ